MVQLHIEKLVYGGDGLARDGGRVVLVPFVLPGEETEADVERAKNDLLRGRVLEIRSPAPQRIVPGCPYFQKCGGCHYQHAAYEYQVEQKREILREVLRRVGKIDYGGEIEAISGEPWAYRNRTQLHIADGAIGYFEFGSHRLCAIERCPISSPKLNDLIGLLSREIPKLPRFRSDVELFTTESEVQYSFSARVPAAVRALFEQLGTSAPIDYSGFRVSRNSFFQVNRFLIEPFVERAVSDARGAAAVDLYAGVGLFTRELLRNFGHVTAVEPGASAHRDLRINVPGAAAVEATADAFLAGFNDKPDLIVADPPRAGLGKEVVAHLARIAAPELRIISCDPATLARDVRALLEAGYRIERLTLVDLFPQTFHLETVVDLGRVG